MTKIIATTVAALTFAALSFGPAAAATVIVKHPAHWHMHQVCKVTFHHHHKVKTCTWVRNR